MRLTSLFVLLLCLVVPAAAVAEAQPDRAQQVIHLLDYIAVEYPAFVKDGRVVDAAEYAEQLEFSQTIAKDLVGFPDVQERPRLISAADALVTSIRDRAPGPQVAESARNLQQSVVSAYKIRIAPTRVPDPGQGRVLYESVCASCHSLTGNGQGPQAAGLDPAPTDFTDRARQMKRSITGLFNTISLGVQGTAMPAFTQLGADQRWALAFYVSQFSATDAERRQGAALWQAATGQRPYTTMEQLVAATSEEARAASQQDYEMLTFLRANPQELASTSDHSPLSVAISKIEESMRLYSEGQADAAYRAAIAAYLDGFELAEGTLSSSDRSRMEQAMTAYRSLIKSAAAVSQVDNAARELTGELEQLSAAGADMASSVSASFAASLIIILREGLEAMLVVTAIAAFLVRAGRRDALFHVHAGWIAALLLGVATWIASAAVIQISGAQREVTEGVTALLSAALLLYAGYWLHNRSHAARWQAFIRGQVTGTLTEGQLWGLALVSFLAVYREVFETVLFMQALWVQAGPGARSALIGGATAGAVLLIAAAWAISRLSLKLPLGLFFGASAAFLAVLAVIFAGRGVAALQAAGKLPMSPIGLFHGLPALGLYPNIQALLVQAIILAVIAGGLLYTRATSRQR